MYHGSWMSPKATNACEWVCVMKTVTKYIWKKSYLCLVSREIDSCDREKDLQDEKRIATRLSWLTRRVMGSLLCIFCQYLQSNWYAHHVSLIHVICIQGELQHEFCMPQNRQFRFSRLKYDRHDDFDVGDFIMATILEQFPGTQNLGTGCCQSEMFSLCHEDVWNWCPHRVRRCIFRSGQCIWWNAIIPLCGTLLGVEFLGLGWLA